jgi:hypothetical protein
MEENLPLRKNNDILVFELQSITSKDGGVCGPVEEPVEGSFKESILLSIHNFNSSDFAR